MKHDFVITLFLIVTFVLAQVVGLFFVNSAAEQVVSNEDNVTTVNVVYQDTAVGPRPQTTGFGSFLYIAIGVLIGTLLVLLIIRFGKRLLWKSWFFLAVALAVTIALGVFLIDWIAAIIAVFIAVWKVWKPNIFVHNISEVLMYAGIAVLLVPLFNVLWAVILLLAISVYDVIAVFRTRHMVKMAQFQTKSQVFAGLMIPYSPKKKGGKTKIVSKPVPKPGKVERKTAILGGGDIAFPLIFAGVVMQGLILEGFSKLASFNYSLIIVLTTTIALFSLFFFARKDKFYPAMPIVTLGCLVGYGAVWLLTAVL